LWARNTISERRTVIKKGYYINQQISAKEVRLIDENGAQLGVLPFLDALNKAKEKELDLILVAPGVAPPVCKLGDFGRFKYEMEKKEKEARKAHKVGTLKEVKLSPKIDDHDIMVRVNRCNEFLQKGHKIKVTLKFRGREITHKKIADAVVDKLLDGIKENGAMDGRKVYLGKNMIFMISPSKGNVAHAKGENEKSSSKKI
jgi:translation initiation factor IF-3